MSRSVSVVIPNYNGKKLLEKNMPFLFKALEFSKIEHEIIVSDDASKDDSVEYLKINHPGIILIASDKNLGFAGNCNRGIFKATKDLIFLLNTDVKLTENYFEHLLPYFNDETVFGVMGALTTESTGELQDGAKYPEWKGAQLNFTLNYRFKNNQPALSLFLSGANALVDRKKIQANGGFNEIFNPFYFEDAELGVRSWRMGWKNYFEPRAVCYHEISSTIKKFNQRKKIKVTARRNKFILHDLHLEGNRMAKWKREILFSHLTIWLTGDFSWYSAYREYKIRREEMGKSKRELERLMKESPVNFTLEEVCEIIVRGIGEREIEVF